jgi:hypothetical protein
MSRPVPVNHRVWEVPGSNTLDARAMMSAVQIMRECGRKDRVRNRVLKVPALGEVRGRGWAGPNCKQAPASTPGWFAVILVGEDTGTHLSA